MQSETVTIPLIEVKLIEFSYYVIQLHTQIKLIYQLIKRLSVCDKPTEGV